MSAEHTSSIRLLTSEDIDEELVVVNIVVDFGRSFDVGREVLVEVQPRK